MTNIKLGSVRTQPRLGSKVPEYLVWDGKRFLTSAEMAQELVRLRAEAEVFYRLERRVKRLELRCDTHDQALVMQAEAINGATSRPSPASEVKA